MGELIGGIAKDDGHGLTKLVGLCEDIGIEENFANNTQRERCHLPIQVNDCSIAPFLLHAFSVLPYALGIIGDLARLEGRGHQFALATVECSLADEDAIALDSVMH